MATTVVTSENLAEFVSTGKVPAFKSPDAKPDAAAPAPGAAPDAKTNGAKAGETGSTSQTKEVKDQKASSQARAADGTFLPADKADTTSAGQSEDSEDAELPERVRRQIGKKHRAMKEAEEFAAQEARRAIQAENRARALEEELEKARGGKSAGQASDTSGDDPEPDVKDFKTVGDYAKALTKWEVRQAAKEGRANQARAVEEAAGKQQAAELAEGFRARQETFQASCPDYEAVLEDCDLDLHNAGMQYLIESEVGPQLAYYLAKPENQHHISRINKLSPTRMIAELGKLEDKIEAQKQQKPDEKQAPGAAAPAAGVREISKAPAPIAPLNADSSTSQGHKDPSQMSFAELREFRRQEAAKGRRT